MKKNISNQNSHKTHILSHTDELFLRLTQAAIKGAGDHIRKEKKGQYKG